MSIFSDLHRTQNQQPEGEQVVGDLIDKKSINYEQVLNNVKDTLINWSRDLIKIKQTLDSNNFFNKYDNDNTIKIFISTLKGDLFESNNWGTFSMDHIYDLFQEFKTSNNCADNTPNTGSTNTCYIVSRELDDKRSIIRLYNTRLKKFKREFDDVWGLLNGVKTNVKDDRYNLYTTGTTFASFTGSVSTLSSNYSNMKSTEGKLISEDTGTGLIGNNSFNDNLSNSKVNISSID